MANRWRPDSGRAVRPETKDERVFVKRKREEFISEIFMGKPAAAALVATLAIALIERRDFRDGDGVLAPERMLPVIWHSSLALGVATCLGLAASYAS